jgi:hypothetical protein
VRHINVHESGVIKLLKGLPPFKATGPDDIPAFILGEAAKSIAPYLSRMLQLSLGNGKIPNELIKANVAPIYKEGGNISRHVYETFLRYVLRYVLRYKFGKKLGTS